MPPMPFCSFVHSKKKEETDYHSAGRRLRCFKVRPDLAFNTQIGVSIRCTKKKKEKPGE